MFRNIFFPPFVFHYNISLEKSLILEKASLSLLALPLL
ncbi:hypothetical protein D593_0378 [Streptococcus intermedius BA1]|nr:hypothetical protein D593_0378 [Streptococcus intermedius BA1]